jgi:RHS repeat-associated protein
VFTDRLGSVRNVGPAYNTPMAYYPYGEERTSTANGTDKFGTYFRDGFGQDYGSHRYYNNNFGRFWSPDPGGIATANPRNPGSWNRYAYTNGDPANYYDPAGTDDINAGCAAFDEAFCEGSTLESNDPMNTGVMAPPGLVNVQCSAMYGLGWEFGGGVAVAACTVNPEQFDELVDGPPAPTCEDLLVSAISGFLAAKDPSLASYASAMEAVGASYDLDPRLFAAIGTAENGQYTNNPFGVGPNGSSTFSSIYAAIASLGKALSKYVYTWNEQSVSTLYNGNKWIVDPKKRWITLQPPAYCVGMTAADKAGCQSLGQTIAGYMTSMGGNPNSLAFPCPD